MKMNNLIEKKTYYNILFSYYGELLTDKQKEVFVAYYEEDYSLSEIAESLSISRNAVHDALKTCIKNLEHFEEVLKLNEKNIQRNNIYKEYLNENTIELINKLKEMWDNLTD